MPGSYESDDSYFRGDRGDPRGPDADDGRWSQGSSRRSPGHISSSSSSRSGRRNERDDNADRYESGSGDYDDRYDDGSYDARGERDRHRSHRSSDRSSRDGGRGAHRSSHSGRSSRSHADDGYASDDGYGRQDRDDDGADSSDRYDGYGARGSRSRGGQSSAGGRSGDLSQGGGRGGYDRQSGYGNYDRPGDRSWDRPGTIRRANYGGGNGSSGGGYSGNSGSRSNGGPAGYGGYAPPSQSRRPAGRNGSGNSGGYGDGFGVAGPPSRSAYGQYGPAGQRAPASQNRQMMGGMGNIPGMPGMVGQPGPWAPAPQMRGGMPGAAGAGRGVPQSAPQRKSRRKLWIALGIVAVLVLLAAGGGGYYIYQMAAPATAAATFCADLKADSYSSAYGFFDTKMQQQVTSNQFSQLAATLNTAEGAIQSCAAATTPNSYSYHFRSSVATAVMVITRANSGSTQSFQGAIHLAKVSGSWEIDALDTGLFGVNLAALTVVNAYCSALQSQNYQAAYATLGSAFTKTKESDYAQTAQLQDQVDGKVNFCQVSAVPAGNSDSATNLTLTIKRDTLGQKQDTLSLDVESNAWKISAIGPQLQGTDLGAYRVVLRFCSDLSSKNYKDLYNHLSNRLKGVAPEASYAELFSGQILDQGYYIRFNGCTPTPSTYKVTGSTASLSVGMNLTDLGTNTTKTLPATLRIVQDGTTWGIDFINFTNGG